MKARFYFLVTLFTALFILLGWNLYSLQLLEGNSYLGKVEARDALQMKNNMRRGHIYMTDKNGQKIPIALAKDFSQVYAVPKKIEDPSGAAKALAPLIGKDVQKLINAFSKKNDFYPLLEKGDGAIIDAIAALNIKGISIDDKAYRYYPFEELGSQTIGFAGMNDQSNEPVGLYGVEKLDDKLLASGGEVMLTIDRNLQAESERILKKLIEDHKATGGSIVMQEPKTGKILALANAPDFNPNEYADFSIKNFTNPAVQGMYEPGSVFKPLTMAAGIDTGVLTPDTTYTDTGSVTLSGMRITNWDQKAHGVITMTNVIEQSVNTGAIFAERTVGHEKFLEYLKRFGFGALTNIDLPDEIRGTLRSIENPEARAIDFATASYGQGPAVTPIQLISAFSSLANGGLLMRPFVNALETPYVVRRVISGESALKVTRMMESAVIKGKIASIPNYRIAGKTGTAFVPHNGRYVETDLIHSYVGFIPAEDAKIVILVKLDHPDKPLAGQTVVPKFKELAQFVLNYYNIPPDVLVTE
ncbi:MAG: penicillin-binding protein 2 [Candidatus Paceibacterota bacterium]|jgi:cell division protein FtsI/penicillin-binding protein 2